MSNLFPSLVITLVFAAQTLGCVSHSKPAPTDPSEIKIRLETGGAIFWNDAPVSQDRLIEKLKEADELRPQPHVSIDINPEAPPSVGDTLPVMKAVLDAKVSLPIGIIGGAH